jgi:ABC-type branched-subunit amino acid transport system ATPase component
MNTLVEGGAGKPAVLELVTNRIKKSSGLTTSSGRPKNISAIVSASIARLKEEGYIIESTWQMVPKPKRDRKTAAK